MLSKRPEFSMIALLCILLFLIPFSTTVFAERSKIQNNTQTNNQTNTKTVYDPDSSNGGQNDQSVVIELSEKRTRNSKHYLLRDGSYKAVITLEDQHYEDENGFFQDIKAELVDESNFETISVPLSKESAQDIRTKIKEIKENHNINTSESNYRAPQVPFDVVIPKQFSKGYSIGKGNDRLKFSPVGSSGALGVLSNKNTIKYENVWEQVDVTLDLSAMGIKETLIMKDSSAPTTYSFEIEGNIADDLTNGILRVQPAWLEDAQGTKRDVQQIVKREGTRTFVNLVSNVEGLIYPVKIDPTVILQGENNKTVGDTMLSEYSPFQNYKSTSLFRVGSYSYYGNYRSLIKFDLSSISSIVLSNAQLEIYNMMCEDDGWQKTVEMYRVSSNWSIDEVYWHSQPTIDQAVSISQVFYGYDDWKIFNLTSLANNWINGIYPNYSLMLKGKEGYVKSVAAFGSSEYIDTKRPKLVVTYNEAPNQPVITSPFCGDTWDKIHTITWNAAKDSDSAASALRYHIQLSKDNGLTWSDIVALTQAGALSHITDFSSVSNSNTTNLRIRAFDGEYYGPWGYSGTFTIYHNQGTNIPNNLSPGNTQVTIPETVISTTPELQWTFSDPDSGDVQSAYQVQIYNDEGTMIIHDSSWLNSSNSSFAVPSGKLERRKTYRWKVRVKDSKGSESPFSESNYIRINTPPDLTMTSYTDGQHLNQNILNFTWEYSDADSHAQTRYQVVGSRDHWTSWSYNSEEIDGTFTSYTTLPLIEGVWDFAVRAFDGYEWSQWSYRSNVVLPNSYEPNDTSLTAINIDYNQPINSDIYAPSDVDFFKYMATTNGYDHLTMSVPLDKNYDVHIYDANMNEVASGTNASGIIEEIEYPVNIGNTYYIKIVGVDGDYATGLIYTLQVSSSIMSFVTTYQYDSNGKLINILTTPYETTNQYDSNGNLINRQTIKH